MWSTPPVVEVRTESHRHSEEEADEKLKRKF